MSVALAFVTIERPHAAARLMRSARRFLPDVPIYVADQSANTGLIDELYAAHGVKVVRMPFDAGLAASRNALVDAITEDYFLLCDDDFELCAESRLDDAVAVLEAAPDVAVVGGRLHDLDERGERVRNWEMYFQFDRHNATFTAMPIYNFAPKLRSVAGNVVFLCDAVLNFCVFRRSAFGNGVRWDEAIKINGEHEDFYLNLKLNTDWNVAYLPSLAALHRPPSAVGAYGAKLRSRQEGWQHFLNKWKLEQHLEIGTGARPLGPPVRQWFADAGATTIDETVADGTATTTPPAGVAALQLRRSPSVTDVQNLSPRPPDEQPLHSLTEPLGVVPFDSRRHNIRFCYAPGRADQAMLLWYRFASALATDVTRAPVCVALHVRWFDDAGHALMWDSGAIMVECHAASHWTPFVAPMPLWPRQAQSVRFEILAARAADCVPLATGLVREAGLSEPPTPGDYLLALALPTREQPAERTAWLTNAIGGEPHSTRRLQWLRGPHALPHGMDFRQPSLEDVETLYFVDWKDLGRRITMLDRACTQGHLTSTVALPKVPGEQANVVGFLKSGSLCRFELDT